MTVGQRGAMGDPERRKAVVIWLAITSGSLLMFVGAAVVVSQATQPPLPWGPVQLAPLALSALSLGLASFLPPRLRVPAGSPSSPSLVRFLVGMALTEGALLLWVVGLVLSRRAPTIWTLIVVPLLFSMYYPSELRRKRLSQEAFELREKRRAQRMVR